MLRRCLWLLVLALAVAISFSAAPAKADTLDFSSSLTGGSVSWNGLSSGALNGSNIPVTAVGFSGGLNSVTGFTCGKSACGLLSFSTGSFMSSTATSITFNGGGNVTLMGDVGSDGDVQTLVTAMFNCGGGTACPTMTFVQTLPNGQQEWAFTGSLTVTSLGEDAMALLPAGAIIQPSSLSLNMFIKFKKGFSGVANSPDLAIPVVVPEPASLLLLGSGLIGVANKLRKGSKKA